MSGIAGILCLQGRSSEPRLIAALIESLRTQGPDAQKLWMEGPMSMGCAALHATPEAHLDALPLVSQDGRYVITFDGRLDNRKELHQQLSHERPLRELSDAALLLAAWLAWSENCPNRLLGDFAFAIWDRHAQSLFLARDHLGARPLYYAHRDGRWAFASHDEALLCLPGVRAEVDETKLADVLAPGPDVDPRTSWLRDVKQLMPGECLSITAQGRKTHRDYWAPAHEPTLQLRREEEYLEAFEAVFSEAVRARLRSSTPPAAMVSGGMDSAGLMAMVRRELDRGTCDNFHAFSAISDTPGTCIETRCIQELTDHPGIEAHTVSVPSMQGMVTRDDLLREAAYQVHPTTSSILLPAMMALAAQRNGHKMMLMGVSGDVTLGIPLRYPARYWRQGRLWRAWQESRAAARNNTYLRGTSALGQWLYSGVLAFLPVPWRLLIRQRMNALAGKPPMSQRISAELAERVQWDARNRATLERHGRDGGGESAAIKADEVFRWPGVTYGLTGFARLAARYGLEFRDPWADRRVVEFFLQIPLEWQVRQGWTKYLVRRAFEEELSPELLWRTGKEHLGWHFSQHVLRHTHPLTPEQISEFQTVLAPLVDDTVASKLADSSDFLGTLSVAQYLQRIRAASR